jgi:hypothetical protein
MLILTNLSSKATTIVSGASAIVGRLGIEEDVARLVDTVNTNHDIFTEHGISGVTHHLSTPPPTEPWGEIMHISQMFLNSVFNKLNSDTVASLPMASIAWPTFRGHSKTACIGHHIL